MIGCTGAPPACGDDPTCGRPPLGVPCKHGGVFVRGPTGPKVDLVQRYVRLDDWHMAYREERVVSPGVPLVLVHGLGMSSRSFEWLMPHLVDDFHVVAVDLPGCGLSEYPPGDLDIAALVTALGDWMDGIDMPTADLVGHSLGGQVVLQLAAQRPDRVRHAVLVAATPDPAFTAVQKAARLLLDGLREPFAFVRVAVGDYLRAHPGRMWRTLRSGWYQMVCVSEGVANLKEFDCEHDQASEEGRCRARGSPVASGAVHRRDAGPVDGCHG